MNQLNEKPDVALALPFGVNEKENVHISKTST
jgi:hypothetical protein